MRPGSDVASAVRRIARAITKPIRDEIALSAMIRETDKYPPPPFPRGSSFRPYPLWVPFSLRTQLCREELAGEEVKDER